MEVIDFCSREIDEVRADLHPFFFDHYRKFWANPNNEVAIGKEKIAQNKELILRHLIEAEKRLMSEGYSLKRISAILFVGNNSANGHAFLFKDRTYAWFAIECFKSERETKVFVMHELIHALHYAAQPELTFTSESSHRLVWRQLIAEGIATYLTKTVWKLSDEEALWGDFLFADEMEEWFQACKNSEKELFRFLLSNFESSDTSIELFNAADPKNIFSYRAGYFAGLEIVKYIANKNKMSGKEFLEVPYPDMKYLFETALLELST